MENRILLLIFVMLSSIVISQTTHQRVDSLETTLKNLSEKDTTYIRNLLTLSELYYETEGPDKCLEASIKVKELSESIGFKTALGNAYNNMGSVVGNIQGNTLLGMQYFNKGIEVLTGVNNKIAREGLASIYNNRGYQNQNIGNIEAAMKDYIASYKIRSQDNNRLGMLMSLNQIGWLYGFQGNQEKSIEEFKEALKLAIELKNEYQQALLYNNIGAAYDNLNMEDTALHYLNKCLAIRTEINDQLGLSYTYNNLAVIYRELNILDSAIVLFQKSLKIREEQNNQLGIVYSMVNLAKSERLRNNTEQATKYLDRGIAIAEENKFASQLQSCYELKSLIAEERGDYQIGLKYYKQYTAIKDSLFNESKSKELGKLEGQYEMEKKQEEERRLAESEKLKAENEKSRRDNLQFSGIFVFVLILFAVVFMSGKFSISEKVAEGLIFFTFLLFFEFILVLADPYIEVWSGGEPLFKLLFNAILAGAIFPLHAFFENTLKKRLFASKRRIVSKRND